MLRLDIFFRDHTPEIFTPRVTPDPSVSERLEAKLHEATRRLRNSSTNNNAQSSLGSQQHGNGKQFDLLHQ
jgi:hypothetical protein